jgi:hypothetical protein
VLEGKARSAATEQQLEAMKEGVKVVAECGGIEVVWEMLRAGFEMFWCVLAGSFLVWLGWLLTFAGPTSSPKTCRWQLRSSFT